MSNKNKKLSQLTGRLAASKTALNNARAKAKKLRGKLDKASKSLSEAIRNTQKNRSQSNISAERNANTALERIKDRVDDALMECSLLGDEVASLEAQIDRLRYQKK